MDVQLQISNYNSLYWIAAIGHLQLFCVHCALANQVEIKGTWSRGCMHQFLN